MKLFNLNVRGVLDQFYLEPYRLSKAGGDAVIDSNAALSEEYFGHLEFPVSDFWYKYFSNKLSIINSSQKGKALDVCAGTGTLCLNIMKNNFFNQCVAIDNSEFAITRLIERCKELEINNIVALKDDVMSTKFKECEFDAVIGNSFLHHLPDNYIFLNEMHRVLKPGACICFTGEPTVSANFLETVILRGYFGLLRALHLKKKKNKKKKNKNTVITDIWVYESESLKKLLEKCGYVDIRIIGFGTLVPLLNGVSSLICKKITGKSMQPDWYWNVFGFLDKVLFWWLPKNWHSHFIIFARK